MERITSLQNNRIKNIVKLGKAKERKAQNLFILEGARELTLALSAGYIVDSVFICPDLFDKTDYPQVLNSIKEDIKYEVSEQVFEKIAYREGSDGLITLAKPKSHTLADLKPKDNPFIIILEAVEKPGNLGAILRSADAAQVDAVIICDPLTDIYNPNAIRSGVGCTFTVPTAVCSSDEALMWLKANNIKSFAAELQASNWYHEENYTQPSAIVMGTEADGLTPFWLNNADRRIKIPMRGKIDSLNVSVSTAVITFEAMRQRGF
ncbi:TrmH family RNA methyltransferase [Dysgonomonas alginatilytica]|uniref:TrmH family RNA methyltransferase n=1 Tax=Dysgonomonas alginatilytica TaxID=1605892 RepID=A0A2V3PQ52_9BACT|nr:RNA methyltransferase [Dysgonomonas alginatilytica]PXV65530.1 TrmH family RNA methyltransferase [Dysgonomonas alginatilytica]